MNQQTIEKIADFVLYNFKEKSGITSDFADGTIMATFMIGCLIPKDFADEFINGVIKLGANITNTADADQVLAALKESANDIIKIGYGL